MGTSRKSARHGTISRRFPVTLIVVSVLAIIGAGVAWEKRGAIKNLPDYLHYFAPVDGRERIATEDDGFDVLLLVLDACRPEKLSAYGFERETTPSLDLLVRDPDAVLFRRHYANGNWTKASTASLFTGMFVHEHGAFKPWQPSPGGEDTNVFATQVLSDKAETMAEMFAEQGYYTFGIVQGHHLNAEFGFAQGFQEYYTSADYRRDQFKVLATNALIRSIKGNYFGYVHLLGCHQPFPPSARHDAYMETYGFDYPEEERISQGVNFHKTEIKELINDGELKLTEQDVRFLHLAYEARARRMDEESVRPILETLKETGRYDRTLIVVTADHGELLYEHESYAHSELFLWEEAVRVPLIVKFPKGKRPSALPREVNELTSSVDLLPALADLLDRPAPAHARGAAIFGGEFAGSTMIEGQFCPPALNDCLISMAFLSNAYKLIEYPGETLLFDLEHDPMEQSSIAEKQPGLSGELEAAAAQLRSESATQFLARPIDTEVDKEALETLRGLGYVQ
jgi:arylsulfatase A-like enzyme